MRQDRPSAAQSARCERSTPSSQVYILADRRQNVHAKYVRGPDAPLSLSPPRRSCRSRIVRRVACAVAHGVNNDLVVGSLVEDKVWIRRCRHTPNGGVVGRHASQRILQEQIGDGTNSGMDELGALRRALSDIIQNRCEVGKGGKRITQPHRPCLAQTARTCSSLANSPLPAAALERAMARRSSDERETGVARSEPASCIMARAMSS